MEFSQKSENIDEFYIIIRYFYFDEMDKIHTNIYITFHRMI